MKKWLGRLWWLIFLVPVVLGLMRLRFDVDVLNLLPGDMPLVRGLKLQQEHFKNANKLIVTLRGDEPGAVHDAASDLSARLRNENNLVRDVVWRPPWKEDAEEAAELIAYLQLNRPPEAFGRLIGRLAPGRLSEQFKAARERLAMSFSPADLARLGYDPLGLTELEGDRTEGFGFGADSERGFASGDGRFRVMYVEPADTLDDYRECDEWLRRIKALINEAGKDSVWGESVHIGYTGAPAFVAEIATGMENDMQYSVAFTGLVIVVLFSITYRRWFPLVWLLFLLTSSLVCTMAVGGLVFGALNVVSLGFAAILLGLSADYGLVLYQEYVSHPELDGAEIRKIIKPGILWSAATTAFAFCLLLFSGLPGLAQLGALVTIGISFSAMFIVGFYLRVASHARHTKTRNNAVFPSVPNPNTSHPHASVAGRLLPGVLAVSAAAIILICRQPGLDGSTRPLEPSDSPAATALHEMNRRLGLDEDALAVIVRDPSLGVVAKRLEQSEKVLENEVAKGRVQDYELPSALWPHPAWIDSNRYVVVEAKLSRTRVVNAAAEHGFNTNALVLTMHMLDFWERMADSTELWLTNKTGRWLSDRFAARDAGGWLAMGSILPADDAGAALLNNSELSSMPGVYPAGWPLLGARLLGRIEQRLPLFLAAVVIVVLIGLRLAFSGWIEPLIGLLALGATALFLFAAMALLGWNWNLLNLMAIPLVFGAGIDQSIHMQMSLNRNSGDIVRARKTTGRALLLCTATTATGFGSLAFSNNAGLAGLGATCAAGIVCVFFVSVLLLPSWWRFLRSIVKRREFLLKIEK
ncbi:MAG: MMPL family transporter [Verrucomicrobia bacterium]|nr:MMPL family transporter [Verrucomicrobiota bacterium]